MKKKTLQIGMTVKAVMMGLMMGVVGKMNGYAQNFTVGNLNYSINEDGISVTVTGHKNGTSATGTLIIPSTVSYLGNSYAVTKIGMAAFYDCTGLTGDLIIPNSVTSIGSFAFQFCSGLTGNLTIPNTVVTIDDGAFSGCSGLNGSLTIPNSITRIGNSTFNSCSSLTGNLNIPNSVTTIGSYAFCYCRGLSGDLNIPNSVTSIGSNAFYGCSGFTGNLTISRSVTTIEYATFSGCSNLSGELVIPNSVTTIGVSAFSGCNSLIGKLTIPSSITAIGNYAFSGCSGFIETLMLGTTPPLLGSSTFVTTTFPIYVPYESLDTYRTASNWSNYANRIYPWLLKSVLGYGEGEGHWHFIALPLTDNTAPNGNGIENMITETAYDLYRFNQSADLEWENWKQMGDHFHFTLSNGHGYLYANQEDVNLIFKGTFNEGPSQAVSLNYDGTAQFAGWNLVGNPFPYAATVSRSYYVMNAGGTAIEPTALSQGTTIAACTGVMVKAEANESNPLVTFAQPTRQTLENKGLLHIAVADTEVLDKAIVSFNTGDALEKYVFNKDNAQIYIPQDGKDYAIATVGRDGVHTVSTGINEMPVNFKATKNGTYTITVNTDNVDLDYLHLIDNLTGADVDLLSPAGIPLCKGGQGGFTEPRQATYTFTAKTTDYASRFRLVFSADGDVCEPGFAYVSNGEIVLTGAIGDAFNASLQIVDMLGHICRDAMIASPNHRVPTTGMAPGVYVLRLINGDDVRTQKIVVD